MCWDPLGPFGILLDMLGTQLDPLCTKLDLLGTLLLISSHECSILFSLKLISHTGHIEKCKVPKLEK